MKEQENILNNDDKILLPLLTEEDLEFFRGKKVVIVGYGEEAMHLCDIFLHLNIEVLGFYSDSLKPRFSHYKRIPVLTLAKIKKLFKNNVDIVVQGYQWNKEQLEREKMFFKEAKLEYSPFTSGEMIQSFGFFAIVEKLKEVTEYTHSLKKWKISCTERKDLALTRLLKRKSKNKIIVCMPPKTADHTLHETFDLVNQRYLQQHPENKQLSLFYKKNRTVLERMYFRFILPFKRIEIPIDYAIVFHKPRMIDRYQCEKKVEKLKIITAVREPISQNISRLYEDLSGAIHLNWIMGELNSCTEEKRQVILEEYQNLFQDHGDDAQKLWDSWVKRYVMGPDKIINCSYENKTVQQTFKEYKEAVGLDFLAYPFDKEKGYTIIKEGNTEVFIYQLEKLNSLVPELSEWVGVPFDKLEKGNVGEDKWTGESYKQAQKHLKITQEYFDMCYDEPYVKHFYSPEDIEKFKARWRPHIKTED